MDCRPDDIPTPCLVRGARLPRDEDTSYSASAASDSEGREGLRLAGKNLSKQAARGKSWRKPDATYCDADEAKLGQTKALLPKSPLKRPENIRSRRSIVSARRRCDCRLPQAHWTSSSASDEDSDSPSFPHRRPNASKFSKVSPNSCVFLPVPEDIFIEDMLSTSAHYTSNSHLKSIEYWSSVAANLPPCRGSWRPRRYY